MNQRAKMENWLEMDQKWTKNGPKLDYKGTVSGLWRDLMNIVCFEDEIVDFQHEDLGWVKSQNTYVTNFRFSANYLILHSLNMEKWWFVVDESYLSYLRDVKSIQNNWIRHLAPSCDMLKIHFSLFAVVIVGEFSAPTATNPIITH